MIIHGSRVFDVLFVFILLLFSLSYSTGSNVSCGLYKYCEKRGQCSGFSSFKDISVASCLQNMSTLLGFFSRSVFGAELELLFLTTSQKLVLDESLDLIGLRELAYQYHLNGTRTTMLYLYNLAGIDLSFKIPQHPVNYTYDKLSIQFSYLNVINQVQDCERYQENQTLANIINSITRSLELFNSQFPTKLCPNLFRNIQLDKLVLYGSYFRVTGKNSNKESLNATIKVFRITQIKSSKFILDDQVLNKNVFANVIEFEIAMVSLLKISPINLFQYLSKLRTVYLDIINTKSFLHGHGGTEWIKYLNYDINTSAFNLDKTIITDPEEKAFIQEHATKVSLAIKDTFNKFDFKYFPFENLVLTDSDFCLFHEFPHKQLVVLSAFDLIHYSSNQPPCVFVWLWQYMVLFYGPNNLLEKMDINHPFKNVNVTQFKQWLEQCNMEQRVKNCKVIEASAPDDYQDPYFASYDLNQALKFIKTSVTNILGPILCIMGLFTNLLVISTIVYNKLKYKNKERASAMNKSQGKDRQVIVLMDEQLYFYMFFNSVLNFIYCLLYLLDFTIICIPGLVLFNNIKLFKQYTYNNCLAKDIVVSFIASILKLVSNVTLIQMAMNRYILLGKDHLEFVVKASNMRPRRVLSVSFVVSVLLSIVIIYELIYFSHSKASIATIMSFSFNQSVCIQFFDFVSCVESPTYLYNDNYYNYVLFYGPGGLSTWFLHKLDPLPILLTFIVIHDAACYIIYCLISLLFDVMTMKKLREVLDEKLLVSSKKDEEQKKKVKSEMKSLIMTITNGLFNFIFRLPDLFSSIFFIILVKNPYIFASLCLKLNGCLDLYDVSNLSYLFTLSFNFVFYYIFNTVFSDSFAEMKSSIKNKLLNK